MSGTIDAYPLCWPEGWKRTPSNQRERGVFTGTPDRVRRELLQEVDRIVLGKQSVTHSIRHSVIISSDVPLRKDGEPHMGFGEPKDPGVAVYFKRNGVSTCLACDKYDRVWKNMRALQKTIEALRGLERWGSSQLLDRAFTGFAALPAKSTPSAWDLLGLVPDASEAEIIAAWREKAKTAHPDAGGSHDAMAALNDAKDIALATRRAQAA